MERDTDRTPAWIALETVVGGAALTELPVDTRLRVAIETRDGLLKDRPIEPALLGQFTVVFARRR